MGKSAARKKQQVPEGATEMFDEVAEPQPRPSPAREAQAKVEKSLTEAKEKPKSKSKAKAKKATNPNVRKFKVDLWATDFNDAEIGIMKRTSNEAASDQFTKDMEIIGQTVDDGERTGLMAFRRDLWREEKDCHRRLVIKLFSENLGWRATMDMMIGRSLQLTLGANGTPVTAFSLNLARHDQVIQLERSAMKWPILPERFSFFIQADDGPRYYKLRRNLVAVGADYTLYDQKGRKIGRMDNRVINLGGAWNVTLDKAHTNVKLERVLTLFCTMLKFNGASRRHVSRVAEKVMRGRIQPDLDRWEEDLYLNPRRRR